VCRYPLPAVVMGNGAVGQLLSSCGAHSSTMYFINPVRQCTYGLQVQGGHDRFVFSICPRWLYKFFELIRIISEVGSPVVPPSITLKHVTGLLIEPVVIGSRFHGACRQRVSLVRASPVSLPLGEVSLPEVYESNVVVRVDP